MKNEIVESELLLIAERDLLSAKVLYQSELYAQSVFSFQQSIEKANKSLGLFLGFIKKEDLIDIGHESIKIYEKLLKKMRISLKELKISEKVPKLKKTSMFKDFDFVKMEKEIGLELNAFQELRIEKNSLINISSKDIKNILKIIKMEKEKADKKKYVDAKEFKKLCLEFLSAFSDINSEYYKKQKKEIKDLDPKSINKLMAELKKILPRYISCYLYLYYMAIITLPHSIITRYPVENLSPEKVYKKSLPIVKMLPILFEEQDACLKSLKFFVQKKNSSISKSKKTR